MEYWVYILQSTKLNRFYIGSTSDLVRRMEFHSSAEKKKITGKADDWELFLEFFCVSKKQAVDIERHIKSMKSKK